MKKFSLLNMNRINPSNTGVSIYTLTPHPSEYVEVSPALETTWLQLFLQSEAGLQGRIVIPGHRCFRSLNVQSVPEGMCMPCLRPASCFFIFPLSNRELQEYKADYRKELELLDVEEEENREKRGKMIRVVREKMVKRACESLDLTKVNRNEAFARVVEYVQKYGVLSRISPAIEPQMVDAIVSEYQKATAYLLGLLWEICDQDSPTQETMYEL